MLRMLRCRSLVLPCVHVRGFVYDARARLLCFCFFGPSVASGVRPFCLALLCSMSVVFICLIPSHLTLIF